MKTTLARTLAPAALAAAALVAPAQSATAEDISFILPAGTGCEFRLGVSWTGGNLQTKEFVDEEGNTVRLLVAGKGTVITYTNYGMKPGRNPEALDAVTIRTDGSVTETVTNPDGTLTVTGTGHNGLIMFPTDEPAGPTTTHFILESTSGQAIDICAELAD
ncbi:hypothetical protein [Pseudarthrobacter oxydans]|uniref:hypothetical protein n=1 Tax=Pseudarthrobacter oxydans TaxID=1671 RepID=UPI00343D47D0